MVVYGGFCADKDSSQEGFKGQASYGYCASKKKSVYDFHEHGLTNVRGVSVDMAVTATHVL